MTGGKPSLSRPGATASSRDEAWLCYVARRGGRPSLPSGRWLRMLLDCYCENMGSERGVEWSCANSQSLTEPLHRGDRDAVPDHSR